MNVVLFGNRVISQGIQDRLLYQEERKSSVAEAKEQSQKESHRETEARDWPPVQGMSGATRD